MKVTRIDAIHIALPLVLGLSACSATDRGGMDARPIDLGTPESTVELNAEDAPVVEEPVLAELAPQDQDEASESVEPQISVPEAQEASTPQDPSTDGTSPVAGEPTGEPTEDETPGQAISDTAEVDGSQASAATLQGTEGSARRIPVGRDLRPGGNLGLEWDSTELAVWNDPKFKRRLIESFVSETEIEPRVTTIEAEEMQEILAMINGENPEIDEAIQQLRERLEEDNVSAVYDFTLGRLFFQREQLDRAIDAFEDAVDKYPKFRRAWWMLGLTRVKHNELAEAIPAITRAIELGAAEAGTYGLLGYCYSSQGKYVAAESAYRMAIVLDPDLIDYKMGLTESLFRQRRYADVVALCDGLIADQPDSTRLWLVQANAFVGLEQPMRAAENYELVDRLGGSTVDSLYNLGDIYLTDRLFGLGVDCFLRALAMDGTPSPDRALRAAGYLAGHGALTEATAMLDGVEAACGVTMGNETRIQLLKLRARVAVARGSGDEEAEVLERIVELDPLDGEAIILLGQHSARAGDDEKAMFFYERAAALEDFEAMALVRMGQLLAQQRNYSDAIKKLERAQKLDEQEHVGEFLDQLRRVAQGR